MMSLADMRAAKLAAASSASPFSSQDQPRKWAQNLVDLEVGDKPHIKIKRITSVDCESEHGQVGKEFRIHYTIGSTDGEKSPPRLPRARQIESHHIAVLRSTDFRSDDSAGDNGEVSKSVNVLIGISIDYEGAKHVLEDEEEEEEEDCSDDEDIDGGDTFPDEPAGPEPRRLQPVLRSSSPPIQRRASISGEVGAGERRGSTVAVGSGRKGSVSVGFQV